MVRNESEHVHKNGEKESETKSVDAFVKGSVKPSESSSKGDEVPVSETGTFGTHEEHELVEKHLSSSMKQEAEAFSVEGPAEENQSEPSEEFGKEKPETPTNHVLELERKEGKKKHPPISYINQKFRNMVHQFPPVEQGGSVPDEVKEMQKKISTEGYFEEEIESFLKRYQHYKEAGRKGDAAMVLLLAAATESKFAQFLLARELFRGEIIRQDHAEAFTQINTLADQNFAEAICDLGQFYEHGVGIGKDRQMALLLYEEAAEMGIARAQRHYERLKNSRGFLGIFKKINLNRDKEAIPLPKKK
jgi:hypothetical protein